MNLHYTDIIEQEEQKLANAKEQARITEEELEQAKKNAAYSYSFFLLFRSFFFVLSF